MGLWTRFKDFADRVAAEKQPARNLREEELPAVRSRCVHSKSGDGVTIELWQRPAEPIAGGDTFSIVGGCDKQFSTCRAKFNNVPNFRGFPHVPGNDFLLHVARSKDKNDGKSRFS